MQEIFMARQKVPKDIMKPRKMRLSERWNTIQNFNSIRFNSYLFLIKQTMILQLLHSRFAKSLAILLAISTLSMSFVTRKETVELRAGSGILLETVNTISSETIIPGQMINFRVTQDVKVGKTVVIPAGSIAKGQVFTVKKRKMLGEPGMAQVQIKSVESVDGQNVYLSDGFIYQEGEERQTLSIVLGVLVCILFLTMKGKPAIVPVGYQVSAVVATNTTIDIQQ